MSFWKRLLFAAAMVFVAVPLARLWFVDGQKASAASDRSTPAEAPNVQAFVAREDAEGVTQNDITVASLRTMDQRVLEMFRAGMTSELQRLGKTFDGSRMTVDSIIAELGDRRLIASKIKVDGKQVAAQVFGIIGDEGIRVVCTTTVPDVNVAMEPACDSKVKETFGVSFRPEAG